MLLAIAYPQALDWLVATYAYSAAALAAPIFAGYAIAQVIGTEVPYAVYGIVASFVVLLVATPPRRLPGGPPDLEQRSMREGLR